MLLSRKIRVLIVDDSAIVRKILSEALAAESDLEVVGTAPDPYVARDKILTLKPDVLTLDIEMPRMDGLTFLKKLMHFNPIPTVVISSLAQSSCSAAIEAMRHGAVEVLAKPGGPYSVGELREVLAAKIRAAAVATVRQQIPSPADPPPKPAAVAPVRAAAAPAVVPKPAVPLLTPLPPSRHVIAIGASTGGTEAIRAVLASLPASMTGIVITQHIPPKFSLAFAQHLNQICPLTVKEATDGDEVKPRHVLVAPGDFHMLLRKRGDRYYVNVKQGPRVCYQRPSVDVLFLSVAEAAGADATGVLLTGMGSDGAHGLLQMRRAGARTIAQDEASCVVFGMPREAIQLGAAERVLSLGSIAASLMDRSAREHTAAVDPRPLPTLQ
jgi:two-component system chemotaxis response regulator CheB